MAHILVFCAVDSLVPIEHIVPTPGIVPTQLAGTASTTTTVCLLNVPADVDDTVLCQLARPFGTVQSAHVLRDDAGRAAVTMSNVDEALRVVTAFNGRLLGGCVVQATLAAPHYTDAAANRAASSLMTLQPLLGVLPTPGCQTVLLRNTAAAAALNGEMMMRQCLPQTTYPAPQTYQLVQLPIM